MFQHTLKTVLFLGYKRLRPVQPDPGPDPDPAVRCHGRLTTDAPVTDDWAVVGEVYGHHQAL